MGGSVLTFSGISRITMKDEKLKAQLKSREGQYLDYPSLAEDVRILGKMYEKMWGVKLFPQRFEDYKQEA